MKKWIEISIGELMVYYSGCILFAIDNLFIKILTVPLLLLGVLIIGKAAWFSQKGEDR